jgi:hypothetical protein
MLAVRAKRKAGRMSAKRIDAPETAMLLGTGLTEVEAKSLERDLATAARAYGRAAARVRKLRADLKRAENVARDARRTLRLLSGARYVVERRGRTGS